MESNKDHTIYTLHISKNNPSANRLIPLAREIKTWFTDRTTDAENTVTLSRQSRLWRCILRNCYYNISKSIFEACIGETQEEKKLELSDTLESIKDIVFNDVPSGLLEARKGTVDVLRSLDTFFSGSPSVYSKICNLPRTNDVLNEEAIEFLYDFMQLCFNLAETRAQYIKEFFDTLNTRFRDKHNRQILLGKIRKLIYTMSNYPRAWYDIVYFKNQHDSATLQINFQLGQVSTTSGPYELEWSGISDTVIETGMLDEETVARMTDSCNVRYNPVSILQHCEMQMLRFLLPRSISNYFNYIGCSRGPCWLCYHVLVNIRSKFNMRQSHLKLYAQWDPPDFLLNQQLQFLNEEMRRLADPTNKANFIHRRINSDCPDNEETFLSPRKVPGYVIEPVE